MDNLKKSYRNNKGIWENYLMDFINLYQIFSMIQEFCVLFTSKSWLLSLVVNIWEYKHIVKKILFLEFDKNCKTSKNLKI